MHQNLFANPPDPDKDQEEQPQPVPELKEFSDTELDDRFETLEGKK